MKFAMKLEHKNLKVVQWVMSRSKVFLI